MNSLGKCVMLKNDGKTNENDGTQGFMHPMLFCPRKKSKAWLTQYMNKYQYEHIFLKWGVRSAREAADLDLSSLVSGFGAAWGM